MRCCATSSLMAATAEARRLGSLLDRPRERVRREVAQPGRRDEVARDRLGVRDRRAVEAGADRGDLAPERRERALEALQAAAIRGRMGRVRPDEGAGDRRRRSGRARGTSYQRCGFASVPWTPRTSAIVTTLRLLLGDEFSSLVMNAS